MVAQTLVSEPNVNAASKFEAWDVIIPWETEHLCIRFISRTQSIFTCFQSVNHNNDNPPSVCHYRRELHPALQFLFLGSPFPTLISKHHTKCVRSQLIYNAAARISLALLLSHNAQHPSDNENAPSCSSLTGEISASEVLPWIRRALPPSDLLLWLISAANVTESTRCLISQRSDILRSSWSIPSLVPAPLLQTDRILHLVWELGGWAICQHAKCVVQLLS